MSAPRWHTTWTLLGLTCAAVAALWVGYALLGKPVIAYLYRADSPFQFLNRVLAGRDRHPVEHYYAHARRRLWQLTAGLAFAGLAAVAVAQARAIGAWLRGNLGKCAGVGLLTLLLLEGIFRAAVHTRCPWLSSLRVPDLYANGFTDDDWWKLYHRFAEPNAQDIVRVPHPLLGWSQAPASDENPLGLATATLAALAASGPKILFYGDSFVYGMPGDEVIIPEHVAEQLPGLTVANLGVRGFGLDQMYLLFRETFPRPDVVMVIVGVLTWDLDRVVLKAMQGQKPYYAWVNGQLVLQGVPITRSNDAYFQEEPLAMKSYLLAVARRWFERRMGLDLRGRRGAAEKEKISRALLEHFRNACAEAGVPLWLVIFHPRQDLARPDWRTTFLTRTCAELGIPFLDTGPALRAYAHREGLDLEAFYKTGGDMHHTDVASRVIAEELARRLRRFKQSAQVRSPGVARNGAPCGVVVGRDAARSGVFLENRMGTRAMGWRQRARPRLWR